MVGAKAPKPPPLGHHAFRRWRSPLPGYVRVLQRFLGRAFHNANPNCWITAMPRMRAMAPKSTGVHCIRFSPHWLLWWWGPKHPNPHPCRMPQKRLMARLFRAPHPLPRSRSQGPRRGSSRKAVSAPPTRERIRDDFLARLGVTVAGGTGRPARARFSRDGGRLTGLVSTMRSVIESDPSKPGGSFIRKPGLRLHCQGAHSAQIGAPVDLAIAGPTDRPPGAVSGLLVGLLAVLGGVCRMGESPINPGGMVVKAVSRSACR